MTAHDMSMPYRFLGNTGLLVSLFSFGSWITFTTQNDEEMAYELMKTAYQAGVNFFDNAELYENGKAEVLMGKAIQKGIDEGIWEREDLVLSTKIYFGDGHEGPNRKGLSRKHLLEGTYNSLKRLQLEYVDLLLCHRPDKDVPIEETVRAMTHLIQQGKAVYWGTSEWSSDDIITANEIAEKHHLIRPFFEQPEYNVFQRSKVEYHYEKLYQRYHYGLTVWSPLASGVLTGKYSNGKIPEGSRLSLESYAWLRPSVLAKAEKADQLKPIAQEIGCSLAEMALAWCAANPRVSTVILGATNKKQLQENFNALKHIPKITPAIRQKIDDVIQFQLQPDEIPGKLPEVHKRYLERNED